MDTVSRAEAKLREIEAQAAELREFLESERRVKAILDGRAVTPATDSPPPVPHVERKRRNRGERTPPKSGKVYDTAMIVFRYMQEQGEGKRTRELLPFVRAAGMEVGGANDIATLSARLGTSQMFTLKGGQWFIKRATAGEGAADNPAKEASTAPLFQSNQENDAMPPP